MASFDDESCDIRLMVREDGRAARYTTVAFNVPPENVSPIAIETSQKNTLKRPPASPKSGFLRTNDKIPKLVGLKSSGPRIRSASAGRDRKSDLQARYWGLLFENLRRAVDEIYQTCETDESIEECKEAIMILETCTKDFRNLIEWLRLKWNYEATPPPQRPTSLAWEVRKSSPSKPSCALMMGKFQKHSVGLARRVLHFDETSKPVSLASQLLEKKIEECSQMDSATLLTTASNGDSTKGKKITKALSVPSIPNSSSTTKTSPIPNRRIIAVPKPIPETPKANTPVKTSVDLAQRASTTGRVVPSKPKSAMTVPSTAGKAGKNALNTEVKCQSWAQKVQTSLSRSDGASSSSATSCTSATISSSIKSKALKTDLSKRKPVVSTSSLKPIKPTVQSSAPVEQEDGWETVRGRTRSRASPVKTASRGATFTLTRASTIVYSSKNETLHKRSSLTSNLDSGSIRSSKKSSTKCRPSAAQSLPSLSLLELERNERDRILATGSGATSTETIEATIDTAAQSIEECCLSEEDSGGSPDQLGEEEAEMARREEALTMEEENLQREMRETERSDTEGEEWEDPGSITPATTPEVDALAVDDSGRLERDDLEEKYHFVLQKCSWAERMEMLDQLEEIAAMDARQPGRALQVHEKLSSPSRRRLAKPCEAFQQHEAKQLRAQLHRAALQEEKARKRRELAKRIDEVRQQKALLLEQKRLLLERKMKQAEEKRQKHLADIVKKAHDEEEKLKEIAFINELEAANKRHDFITHIQTQEERIQGLQEERLRRQEEKKLAKEAAVEERKRALEAERLAKMAQLQEKRRQREERIRTDQQEKEKERLEMAREKQRDREERLSALQAAHQASLKGLQQRLQKKQEESARRHEENMEQIRQKALELSILRFSSAGDEAPRLVNYETTRVCTLCDVVINSEVILMSHLRGRTHIEALRNHHGGKEPSREQSETSNLKFIVDAPPAGGGGKKAINEREKRQRALKKRSKKLRQMLLQRPESLPKTQIDSGSSKSKIVKIIKDLERDKSGNTERQWTELSRLLEKGSNCDHQIFYGNQGVSLVNKMLSASLEDGNALSSSRVILTALNIMRTVARSNLCFDVYLMTTKLAPLMLELLAQRLDIMENASSGNQSGGQITVAVNPLSDNIATAVMNAWVTMTEPVSSSTESTLNSKDTDDFFGHVIILISYAVSLGLVDRLARHIGGVRGPLDNHSASNEFLLVALKFLTSLVDLLYRCRNSSNTSSFKKNKGKMVDTTQLIEAFQFTESAGTVNALYGLLLHQGVPSRGLTKPPQLLDNATSFTQAALQLLHRLALLDLSVFQHTVGAEGVSLEFRHISSYLLWYAVHWPSATHLLHLTILCIGYFAARHHDNQMILQSGHMPSVLQQLCRLPFQYFSEKKLQAVLFPTLLACCHDNQSNRIILEKEMSYQMLDDFVNSEDGRGVHLVEVVLGAKN